jgi:hypothetical protein
VDKLKKTKYDSIQVKPSYIKIPIAWRFIFGISLFLASWLFFLLLFAYLAVEFQILWLSVATRARNDEFTVKVVEKDKPDEIKALLELGFDPSCQTDNHIFLRKHK